MTACPVPLAGDCTTTRTSGQRRRDRLGRLGPGHDDDVLGPGLARRADDPGQHRQPAQLVQDLRQRRAHPGAHPAGHDDRGDGSHRRGARGSARAVYRASAVTRTSSARALVAWGSARTGAPGFEPGITGPKPVALPLGHAPPARQSTRRRRRGLQPRLRSPSRRISSTSSTTTAIRNTKKSVTGIAHGDEREQALGEGHDPGALAHGARRQLAPGEDVGGHRQQREEHEREEARRARTRRRGTRSPRARPASSTRRWRSFAWRPRGPGGGTRFPSRSTTTTSSGPTW